MAELSHRALRHLIEGFGHCDEYYTEIISAGALLGGGRFEHWYLDPAPSPHKLVYQLVGGNPEHLAKACALLDRSECAGIDINMGCAAHSITKSGGGVAWMASIDKTAAMMDAVRSQTTKRLSVKLRLGFTEDLDYLVQFALMLERSGVERITLHPRLAGEKLRRASRWEYVTALRERLSIEVAGNGDIKSAPELTLKLERCSTVMAGRLAVRCPWVFAQARLGASFTAPNLEDVALRFLDLLAAYQPPEFHKSRAHRFFTYYCDNFTWAHYLRTLLYRETELSAMRDVLTAYFRETPEERGCAGA